MRGAREEIPAAVINVGGRGDLTRWAGPVAGQGLPGPAGRDRRQSGPTRRALLVGSLAAAASVLSAACGPLTTSRSPETGSAVTPATVRFYFSGDPVTRQLMEDLKAAYERAYPKYTLELVQGPNEIEQLLIMLAGGDPVDVFWNRVRTTWWLIWGQEGALVDLTPLMKRDKLDINDFWPSAMKNYTHKGGFYGLPNSASSNAVYYNKEHFRQVGLPFPIELEKQGKWDWNALVDVSRKLTRLDPTTNAKQFGFMRTGGLIVTVQYMWQNGGNPISDDRTQCLLQQPDNVEAVQFVTDLVRAHQVTPGLDEAGDPTFRKNFRCSMEQAGRYIMPDLLPALKSGTLDAGMVVAPRGPKADTTRGEDLASSLIKGTRALDATWAFAKLWSSPEGQAITIRSNRTYTSRRSVAHDPTIMKQVLFPWEDIDEYFKGLVRGAPFPVTPQFQDVQDIYAREENLVYQGAKTARQAMEGACAEIQPLLPKK